MTVYVKPDGGERVLLDTLKAHLDYEGEEMNLTGAVLSLYEVGWAVEDGSVGCDDAQEPCKILILVDPFTGLRIEVPLPMPVAEMVAGALLDRSDNGHTERRWRLPKRR